MSQKTTLVRRDFLKGVAGGAAFSLPTILTRPVFGGAAPSNRVNIGQIGCGNIGSNYHIPALSAMADVRIVAVADAYKSRREAAAARLNAKYGGNRIVQPYADFREILARADIDAVIVGAHDNWHTPMSLAAVKAGKDVYCQKPLGLDFGLAGALRKAVREKQRICQMANLAAITGRTIQWDPEEEKIVNDPESAKLLVRACRKKWKVW